MEQNGERNRTTETSNDTTTEADEAASRLLATHIQAAIPPKRSSLCYIYRVPDNLRTGNEHKYDPSIVSIGPYHRNRENLKVTEKHKMWYLSDLISRSKPSETSLEAIVKAIKCLELEAREWYAEEINLTSDEFVTMMILDGSFILELFNTYKEGKGRLKGNRDPLFSAFWVVRNLQRDLLLLENQLPFIVLECLFKETGGPKHRWSLHELILNFFNSEFDSLDEDENIQGKHLLDLLRNYFLPSDEDIWSRMAFPPWMYNHYCATQLREIGVEFRSNFKAKRLLDITFSEDGVLEIPRLYFGEGLTVLIPNLVALEQCHEYYSNDITSYVILLDNLIKSKDDVQLLSDKKIIIGGWDEDEKIATEIKTFCRGIKHSDKFRYHKLFRLVKRYTNTPWRQWRATLHKWKEILMSDYFTSPWAVLSMFAALVLLVLTLLQTIFTIRSSTAEGKKQHI